jgi:DNA (cytosine-5)-methyltransferase 1
MKHLDLFSGIGGFALACDWAGIETIVFCEMDKFCQKVLKKHWPDVAIVEDVNNVEEIKAIALTAYSKGGADRFNPSESERWGNDTGCVKRDGVNPDTYRNGLQEPWPEQQTSGDRQLLQAVTNTVNERLFRGSSRSDRNGEGIQEGKQTGDISRGAVARCDEILLTAGFPCQPFSNAGRKRGSSDDRYLWPQTLAVIEAVKPDWIILENVPGILNMVFPDSGVTLDEQSNLFQSDTPGGGSLGSGRRRRQYDTIIGAIMEDLRKAGYGDCCLLVIPAALLSAPHLRQRVWIVGNRSYIDTTSNRRNSRGNNQRRGHLQDITVGQVTQNEQARVGWGTQISTGDSHVADTGEQGLAVRPERYDRPGTIRQERQTISQVDAIPGWSENWYEVATRFCRMDDGVPNRVDRLKSLGNAIVPQVAYQLIKAIKEANHA